MSVFSVIGIQRYPHPILQAGTVRFESNSKLVLSPVERNTVPPTTLTIIAEKIEIVDYAEITYDLDGLPGLDPQTPAPPQMSTAPNGANGGSSPGEGSYPQADNGGNGQPGQTGQKGVAGINAPELEIFVGQVSQVNPDAITVNFKGQDGGKGEGEETAEQAVMAKKVQPHKLAIHGTMETNVPESQDEEATEAKEATQDTQAEEDPEEMEA
jgi:hypothetical protein